ncbi:unnamed protein product [Scytosiphon promiscuus]
MVMTARPRSGGGGGGVHGVGVGVGDPSMQISHFSDSASSLDAGDTDDESLLYAAAPAPGPGAGAAGAAAAAPVVKRRGSGSRRRSGGIPSLISRHGSRSNLGVENGISRVHEISSQAAAAATLAAEMGGYKVATLPPTHSGGTSGDVRTSGGGGGGGGGGSDHHRRLSSSANGTDGAAAQAAEGGVYGGESSSSEGDMTWEDYLATTDEGVGDPAAVTTAAAVPAVANPASSPAAAAAAAAESGGTAVGARRTQQTPQQGLPSPASLPPAAPTRLSHHNSPAAAATAAGGIWPRAGPRAAPSSGHFAGGAGGSQDAPSQPAAANPLSSARAKEAGMSFGGRFTSWGTSKAEEERREQGVDNGAGGDRDADRGVRKQELTWSQFVNQRSEEPPTPPSRKPRGGPEPPRKPSADFDAFDDDDDNDIDDIMSTFGPVSIRTGQEDILFCPQDEEPLPMFDRIIGRARGEPRRQSDGRGGGGGGGVRVTGGAAGGGAGGASAIPRENGGGGRSGTAGGGRMAGGIRGSAAKTPAQQVAEAAPTPPPPPPPAPSNGKQGMPPPPAYSSLPRPREAPAGVSPTFGGPVGGKAAGQGRSAAPRGQRRDGDAAGVSEESASSGRIFQGASSLQARSRGAGRPRSHPAPGESNRNRFSDGDRRLQRQRASTGQVGSQGRLGVPLSVYKRGQERDPRRKEGQHDAAAAAAGSAGRGGSGGNGASSGPSTAPLSPPPYSGGERILKGGHKGLSKHHSAPEPGRTSATGFGGAPAPPGRGAGVSAEAPGAGASAARAEPPPKLTASALQHLQPSIASPALAAFEAREVPEGLPSARQGGTYWGQPPPALSGPPARERSHTEESQVRPPPVAARPRTGSAGSGGLGLASTTAAALRSAMTLLRNDSTASRDTAPATTSSLGSRVFKTFSSASSGGARGGSNADQKGAVAHANSSSSDSRGSAGEVVHTQSKRMIFGSSRAGTEERPRQPRETDTTASALEQRKKSRRIAEAKARGQARAQAERAKAEKLAQAAHERVLLEEKAFVEAYSASAAAEAEQEAVARERELLERPARQDRDRASASPLMSSANGPFSAKSNASPEVGSSGATAVKRGSGGSFGFFAASPPQPALSSPAEPAPIPGGQGLHALRSVERPEPKRSFKRLTPTPPPPNARVSVGNGDSVGSAAVTIPAAAVSDAATVPTEATAAAATLAGVTTEVANGAGKVKTLEASSVLPSGGGGSVATESDGGGEAARPALEEPPALPLTQVERDENILRAHLASWRFCFHEAAALLTPVLGAGCVDTPHGGGDSGHATGPPGRSGFAAALAVPSEEADLHSELWAKLVQAEALMLQTMLSVSSGANKDTLSACEAVSEALELSLPPTKNRESLREDIAFKLAGAVEVARARSGEASPASPEAHEAVSVPPTLAEQVSSSRRRSMLMELEVLMVRVAMQLMAGHMYKAATSTRKFLKMSHWLLKVGGRAQPLLRERNAFHEIFRCVVFVKGSPVPRRRSERETRPTRPTRAVNGDGGVTVNGRKDSSRSSSSTGSRMSNRLIEGAVPTEFAGRSWEGYLHHVDFIVALMHGCVGLHLLRGKRGVKRLIGHVVGYTPSFDKGLSLLSSCCRTKGMRRPCAGAVLELLVFREVRGRVGSWSPCPCCQSRHEYLMARAEALDNAQVALESFYASFPVVPLLSVAHAKALQTSGEYEEAYDLCLMAQKVVDESVEKGDGMGPAHDPHVLWLQLASSSFFLQRWSRALEVFTRIVEGVTQQVCENDKRGLAGFSAAYAAASMCGVQPVDQAEVHKLLVVACSAIKKQEAAGAKEHPGLRGRLEGYAARGPPGAELWLFELLYLHNASAANSMPEAWHESMLELLGETPVAQSSRAFPQPGNVYTASDTDAIMAHKFTEGLVLYKLERMEESLDIFRFIADCARDKDEAPSPREAGAPPQVVLTESRFVLPHSLYLTAHLSYRLRPIEEQLHLSHDLCVRAKRIKDYDFDCQAKIGNLMASLRNYMDAVAAAAR